MKLRTLQEIEYTLVTQAMCLGAEFTYEDSRAGFDNTKYWYTTPIGTPERLRTHGCADKKSAAMAYLRFRGFWVDEDTGEIRPREGAS